MHSADDVITFEGLVVNTTRYAVMCKVPDRHDDLDCGCGTVFDVTPFDGKVSCVCGKNVCGDLFTGGNCEIAPTRACNLYTEEMVFNITKLFSREPTLDEKILYCEAYVRRFVANHKGLLVAERDSADACAKINSADSSNARRRRGAAEGYTEYTFTVSLKLVNLDVDVPADFNEIIANITEIIATSGDGDALCADLQISNSTLVADDRCNVTVDPNTTPGIIIVGGAAPLDPRKNIGVAIGAAFGGAVLVLGVLLLIQKLKPAPPPFDFSDKVAELVAAGELSITKTVDPTTPREIPRSSCKLTEKLGEGQFGEVHKGVLNIKELPGGSLVAVKTVTSSTSDGAKELVREAALMCQVPVHQNLVDLIGVTTRGVPLLLILSFCEHGSLLGLLRWPHNSTKPSPIKNRSFFQLVLDVAHGMEHLHTNCKIVHRDLATRNVLVDSLLVCKIADFGLSRGLTKMDGPDSGYYRATGAIFPLRWTDPSAMRTMVFDASTDIWSFGIVMLEVIEDGATPYAGLDNNAVLEQVPNGYRAPKPERCSDAVYKLMRACWNSDPESRPRFPDVVNSLQVLSAAADLDEPFWSPRGSGTGVSIVNVEEEEEVFEDDGLPEAIYPPSSPGFMPVCMTCGQAMPFRVDSEDSLLAGGPPSRANSAASRRTSSLLSNGQPPAYIPAPRGSFPGLPRHQTVYINPAGSDDVTAVSVEIPARRQSSMSNPNSYLSAEMVEAQRMEAAQALYVARSSSSGSAAFVGTSAGGRKRSSMSNPAYLTAAQVTQQRGAQSPYAVAGVTDAYGRTSFDATAAMLFSVGQLDDALPPLDRGYVDFAANTLPRSTVAGSSTRSTASTLSELAVDTRASAERRASAAGYGVPIGPRVQVTTTVKNPAFLSTAIPEEGGPAAEEVVEGFGGN